MPTNDEIWADDLLDRRQDAQVLFDFLLTRQGERDAAGERGAYVVNLNAAWGHGKTFFLERLKAQIESAGHPTAFINAWRDDSSQEPVVAVMAAIEAGLKPFFAKDEDAAKAWNTAKAHAATIFAALVKGASRKLAEKYAGQAVGEIEALLKGDQDLPASFDDALIETAKGMADAGTERVTTLLTGFVDKKIQDYEARLKSAAQFQNRLRNLLVEIGDKAEAKLPLFVFIDELDRCRPTYAIEMLEQVKHLFDIDSTIFVIATDGDQLAHSISAVYGEQFDGKRYLLRFFHRHYRFEPADLTAFAEYAFTSNRIDVLKLAQPLSASPAEVFVGAMKAYDLTLRDAHQCFDLLKSAVTLWPHKTPLQLTVILPLIIHFQRHELDKMKSFFDGADTAIYPREWGFPYEERNRHQVRRRMVATSRINQALLAQRNTPIEKIIRGTPNGVVPSYAYEVIARELQQVHNGRIDNSTRSVLSEYPGLVRSVGRFAPPQVDADLGDDPEFEN